MARREIALALIVALAAAHLGLCLIRPNLIASNLIQLIAVAAASVLCLLRANRGRGHLRWLWYGLLSAFLLWGGGQIYYFAFVAAHRVAPGYPNPADFFWLLYCFPILLIASSVHEKSDRDWTSALDMAQTGLSVVQMSAAIFLIPGSTTIDRVYDIQGFAMLFVTAIRLSTAKGGDERVFFRDLIVFVTCYDVFGGLTQITPEPLRIHGSLVDLAWSFSFLAFCAVAIRFPDADQSARARMPRLLLPAHIHGVSALGLALTSIASSVMLLMHHVALGVWGLSASCGVFALRMAVRESKLTRAQLDLEHDNCHDHLTGLANRNALEEELAHPRTSGKNWLLFLDLDRFKVVNDSLGHEFGDRLLIHVANVLRSVVRSGDIVSRLGGDEFVVLLKDCPDGATAKGIAERILERLGSPVLLEERLVHVTGSIGVAALQEGRSKLDVLHNADAAMYIAKSLGRNCVRIFDRSILERAARDLEMETDLRQSIEDGSISVAYQPIFSVPTQELVGFEALARWNHPRLGKISPDRFIPLAEETGLILKLGLQVLTRACFQVAAWNREFGTKLCVGVNVSAKQLADRTFLAQAQQILNDARFDASLLRLEITESVLLEDRTAVDQVLRGASSSGIEISLDDFGTGYSALNYLVEFPFHTIKIDKGFLRDIERDPQRAMLLGTIVQLAKNLNKKVVAEGIETPYQLRFLAKVQCDFAQGFLLSKPLSAEKMTEFLKSNLMQKGPAEHSLVLILNSGAC